MMTMRMVFVMVDSVVPIESEYKMPFWKHKKVYSDDMKRILSLTAKELVEGYCVPWQGAESDFEALFGKYGYTVTGIYEKWHWYTKDDLKLFDCTEETHDTLDNVTFDEAFRMVAITHAYWQPMHDKQSAEYSEYQRLDMIRRLFMRHPEQRAEYFRECPDEKDVYYKRFPEEKALYETE